MSTLKDKTLFITGASRGIGKAIALRAAKDGANIVIAAKTAEPHPTLPGTIHTAAREVEEAGGRALPLQVDIRFDGQVVRAMDQAVEAFGGIDILVNNASAIRLADTLSVTMKQFDLMFSVNVRGTFTCTQAAVPHLRKRENPHILNLSPPISLRTRWFENHCAYTISKYGMSMCVLGMAEEFGEDGIAVNALWPRSVINTSAIQALGGVVDAKNCRTPEILADAAHIILTRDSGECTGNFFIDDEVLEEAGIDNLDAYAVSPGEDLLPDLFLD